jgi:hypothetical protein
MLLDNPKLSPHIIRVKDKENVFSLSPLKKSILELEVNIEAMNFIEKVRIETSSLSGVKLIPSYFLRTICIKNINELSPLIDLYFALKQVTPDTKKITLVEDAEVPGVNKRVCIVEYNSHSSAKKAISLINTYKYNTLNSVSSILSSAEAEWCEPLVDTIKEILKSTPFCYFQNLPVDTYDIFHFKSHLEETINSLSLNKSYLKIRKIRQFEDKVLVQFDKHLPSNFFETKFYYRDRLIPIIPAMKPNLNVGKYKEKVIKASVNFMNEEDKKFLSQRFDSLKDSTYREVTEGYRKKAEGVYNKLILEEKKIKEKEKEREREREREKEREREALSHKRERSKSRDKKRDKKHSYRDRSQEKIKRPSSPKRDQVNLGTQNQNPQALLTNLLLSNPNSANLLSGLQNLQNIQSILANPSLLSVIQNLVNVNNPQSVSNLAQQLSQQTQNQNLTQTSASSAQLSNVPSSQSQRQSNFSAPMSSPHHNIPQSQPMPSHSTQINPVYNLPKLDNQLPQNVYYQQPYQASKPNTTALYQGQGQGQQNPQFGFSVGMPVNNEMFLSGMSGMPYSMNMQEYPMNSMSPNSEEMDQNLLMKKYYEYYQTMNSNMNANINK